MIIYPRVFASAPIHLGHGSAGREIKEYDAYRASPKESVMREEPIILRSRMLSTRASAWWFSDIATACPPLVLHSTTRVSLESSQCQDRVNLHLDHTRNVQL